MSMSLTTILPSIAALGLAAYWMIGAASALEAFFLTGVFVPGTLIVDAGGMLVQRGVLDFWDLVWFVAIGSAIGGEASYWTGRFAYQRLVGRWRIESWPAYSRAEALFARRGGLALVIGRFLGPVSGLVPLVAALARMDRRKFMLWNAFGSFPYALGHLTLGYLLGNVLSRLGPLLTRLALFAGIALAVLAVVWWVLWRILRLLPRLAPLAVAVRDTALALPPVRNWVAAHPGAAGWIGRRAVTSRFSGLPLTVLFLIFLYVLVVWVDGLTDLLRSTPFLQVDQRLAMLIHSLWSPGSLQWAAHVTALGDLRVVSALAVAMLIWLLRAGRRDLAVGLALALVMTPVSVAILKAIFHRPPPALAYFAESANSFPSGHAAIAVAVYGMIFYAAWRIRWIGAVGAAFLASFLALFIGLGQLVLIESYLTDVLNGWLLGGLWLVAAITVAEWIYERRGPWPAMGQSWLRAASPVVAVALVLSSGWAVARFDRAPAIQPRPMQHIVVATPEAIFSSVSLPRDAESLLGAPLEPVNLIFVAPDGAALARAISRAGWTEANLPSPSAVAGVLMARLSKAPDPAAPMTPFFWDGKPNSMAFTLPLQSPATRARHHLRLWDSGAVLKDGRHIYVGAASLDRVRRGGLSVRVAPGIDMERDLLVKALVGSGAMRLRGLFDLTQPVNGSAKGGSWVTDGRAAVLTMR